MRLKLKEYVTLIDGLGFNANTSLTEFKDVGFNRIGSGSEGVVVEHIEFIGMVVKFYFRNRTSNELELTCELTKLNSKHIPAPLSNNEEYKVMEAIYSTPLISIMSNEANGFSPSKPVFKNIGTTGLKFNYADYKEKMESLIKDIILLASKGVFINDLSLDNVHYDFETEEFIVLDYDVVSSEMFEFPRFLEASCMSVFKNFFLAELMKSNVDKRKCIDVENRLSKLEKLRSNNINDNNPSNWIEMLVENGHEKSGKTDGYFSYIN